MVLNTVAIQDCELDRLSAPMGFSSDSVGRSFFDDNDAVTFLRDSTGLGWHGAQAAVTDERPHETVCRPVPAVWIATGLSKTSLRRFIRGREHYDPAIPGPARRRLQRRRRASDPQRRARRGLARGRVAQRLHPRASFESEFSDRTNGYTGKATLSDRW